MKRIKAKGISLLVTFILVIASLLSSCGAINNNTDTSLTITDSVGDVITLPEEINRVVSTSDPCTDMILALGQGDKLVGAYFRALSNPWFSEFYSNASNITSFNSYQPEVEALIAIDTDIIFVPSIERAQALREKGVCAICIRFYTPQEIEYSVNLLGEIFGGDAKQRAQQWLEDFHFAQSVIAQKLLDVSESERPVAYEILADKGRGPFRTYYGDNQAWLSYAGGILATKDFAEATSNTMPTEEAILATNPSIIFIGGTYATKEYSDLLLNEKWQNIDAVKNGNIFIEPTGALAWNSCSTTYPLLIYYCFSCMYPDKVDFDIKELSHDFYKKYYNKDFDSTKLDLMLRSKAPDGTELWN